MLKKISVLFLLILVIASLGLSFIADAKGVAIGSRSEEVKTIQDILKEDPSIYPEGYVTGYFGTLTEQAIKKLQKRCGIPETGILDETTEKCIYPIDYKVTVVSPNGGEVWNKNTIQTIKWEVTTPPGIAVVPPLWPKASIDLFRRVNQICPSGQACPEIQGSVFVKHLATVNLLDKSYSWKVSSDIPNSKDYVVRISIGKNIASLWRWDKNQGPQPLAPEIWPSPIPPTGMNWDESDKVFEITGEGGGTCPSCPVCPNTQKIEQAIAILQNMIAELQKAIALLK